MAPLWIVLTQDNSNGTTISSIIEQTIDFSNGPVQCEIVANERNGTMVLESVVHSLESASGSYVLMVASQSGNNRSRVQQGGNFVVDADEAAILGKLMLNSRGATYDVSLKLSVNGRFVECVEKFQA